VAFRFPDWVDWIGIFVLLLIIFAALLWIWWQGDHHR
jgi:hypothetical protein